jgi:hypothetical protein
MGCEIFHPAWRQSTLSNGSFTPLGDRKPGVMALITPPKGDYAIAPDEGPTMFCGIVEPDEVAGVVIRLNCCGMKPQPILSDGH